MHCPARAFTAIRILHGAFVLPMQFFFPLLHGVAVFYGRTKVADS